MAEQLVKVIFELDRSEWHGHDSEGMWATPIAGSEWRHFRLLNSPFFAMGVSYQDVVRAKPAEHELLFEFEERGGHSSCMLIMQASKSLADAYWGFLQRVGCCRAPPEWVATRRFGQFGSPPGAALKPLILHFYPLSS